MFELELAGCRSTPLAGYLKGLGILRLLVEQGTRIKEKDPARSIQLRSTQARWQGEQLCLKSALSEAELVQFFLHAYVPTPLIAPWNGSTGFYPKDKRATIDAILTAKCDRLQPYRETIAIAQQVVTELGLTVQPKEKEEKRKLLTRLRNRLPDEAMQWLDTCACLAIADLKFPPLTGTGGNDGNFEFSRTFMQQLQEVIDFATGQPTAKAEKLLEAALLGRSVPGLEFTGKIGQFSPIAAGGANAAPGYDAESRVNPWDYILMVEGLLLFTAGATRRYESLADAGEFVYPFTVRGVSVGYDSAAAKDEIRAELWVPLWSRWLGWQELQVLFREGRAKVGERTARDGIDFARSIASLGIQRGIDAFLRYSFQERNGLSYFAIPLGKIQVQMQVPVNYLVAIDGWRERVIQAVQDEHTPQSMQSAVRSMETAIFKLSLGRATLLDVVISLGQVEAALARSLKFTQEKGIKPLWIERKTDVKAWVQACNDDSIEFRLALALAGNGLRQRLVPVQENQGRGGCYWAAKEGKVLDRHNVVWTQGSLVDNLLAWLRREEIEATQRGRSEVRQTGMKTPRLTVSLAEIADWLMGRVDDQRIEAIARGLCLLNLRVAPRLKQGTVQQPVKQTPLVVGSYALFKLVHQGRMNVSFLQTEWQRRQQEQQSPGTQQQLTDENKQLHENTVMSIATKEIDIPPIPGLLAILERGDSARASELAIQRLRASRLQPAIATRIREPVDRTRRIGAALAFPVTAQAMASLLWRIQQVNGDRSTTETDEEKEGSGDQTSETPTSS